MSGTGYLIAIGLLVVFAIGGTYVAARADFACARSSATLFLRLSMLALYVAGMIALGWFLWRIVPPAVDWLAAQFGSLPVFLIAMAVPTIAGLYSWREHRRHPEWSIHYRKDSGKFVEPRDP